MVAACRFRQTLGDGLLEGVKVLIVGAVEAFFSDEFPQAFNQIEIGGVSRQKQEFNPESRSPPAIAASPVRGTL